MPARCNPRIPGKRATGGFRPRPSSVVLVACLAVAAAAGVLIAMHGNASSTVRVSRVISSRASYVVDVADKRALVGWSDNVFLGRVVAVDGTGRLPDSSPKADLPYTLFEVVVLQNLKGKLGHAVVVRQDTGLSQDGVLYTCENDPLLVVGSTYLLVTKGSAVASANDDATQVAPGCPRVVNKFGDLPANDEVTKARLLAEFRDAVAEQIPFQ